MNAQEIARKNFYNYAKSCYLSPSLVTFVRPNANTGYGAILKLLANGNQPSRKAILSKLGIPTWKSYYSGVFNRILKANLISYTRANGYELTALGKAYVAENLA